MAQKIQKPDVVIPEKVLGHEFGPMRAHLNVQSCMIYSIGNIYKETTKWYLGIGYSRDPLRLIDLDFTNEMADDFQVFPLNASVLREFNQFKVFEDCPGLPSFNPNRLLHSESSAQVWISSKFDVLLDFRNSSLRSFMTSAIKKNILFINLNFKEKWV